MNNKNINISNQILYNQENINEVRKYLQESNFGAENRKVLRMIEKSTGPCKVTISEESRNICVRSLTKLK